MSQRNPAAERIARLRQSVVNLPGIGFGSPLVLALGAADAAAQALNLNLRQMGVLGGVAAVGIAGVALALTDLNKQLEQSKARLTAALAAQQNYYDALGNATTESVNAQIETLQQLRPLLEQQIAETQGAIDAALARAEANPLIGKSGRDLFRGLVVGDLDEALKKQQQQLQENIDTETRLTQGREAGAFVANDLAEAERQLATEREKYHRELIAQFDEDAQMRLRLAALRRNGSSGQVSELLAANTDRINIITNLLLPEVESLGLTSEAATARTQALNNELDRLIQENGLLLSAVLPVIEARENEVAALELVNDQYDNYLEALDLEKAAREQLAEISRQLADLEEETAERRQQAAGDRAERITDIEADSAGRRAKIIEDGLERINKIQRDAGRKQLTAIGLRDALALFEAKQAAKDALDDQKVAQEKSLKSAMDAAEKQRRSLERQYQRQQESIDRAYAKRYEALQYQQQKEQVALQNAVNAIRQIAVNGSGGLIQIQTDYWIQAGAAANAGMGSVVGAIVSHLNALANGIGGGAGGIGPGGIGGGIGSIFGGAVTRIVDNRLNLTLRAAGI